MVYPNAMVGTYAATMLGMFYAPGIDPCLSRIFQMIQIWWPYEGPKDQTRAYHKCRFKVYESQFHCWRGQEADHIVFKLNILPPPSLLKYI